MATAIRRHDAIDVSQTAAPELIVWRISSALYIIWLLAYIDLHLPQVWYAGLCKALMLYIDDKTGCLLGLETVDIHFPGKKK